jgi:hypothetical protein
MAFWMKEITHTAHHPSNSAAFASFATAHSKQPRSSDADFFARDSQFHTCHPGHIPQGDGVNFLLAYVVNPPCMGGVMGRFTLIKALCLAGLHEP